MKHLAFLILFFIAAFSSQAQPKLTVQSKSPCPYDIWVQTASNSYNFTVQANSAESIYLPPGESPCIIQVLNGTNPIIKAYGSCANGTDGIAPVPQCVNQFSPITNNANGIYTFRYWLQP